VAVRTAVGALKKSAMAVSARRYREWSPVVAREAPVWSGPLAEVSNHAFRITGSSDKPR
jgi:hypothetical protein